MSADVLGVLIVRVGSAYPILWGSFCKGCCSIDTRFAQGLGLQGLRSFEAILACVFGFRV